MFDWQLTKIKLKLKYQNDWKWSKNNAKYKYLKIKQINDQINKIN